MNTLLFKSFKKSLKKTGEVILLSLCFTGIVAAQEASSPDKTYDPPKSTSVAPPPSPGSWTYGSPLLGSPVTPSIEKSGTTYLPFLPWTGQNVALLANYADFFYQLEKANTSSPTTNAFDTAGTIAANNMLSQTKDSNMQAVSKKTTEQYQEQLTFFPDDVKLSTYAKSPGTDITIPCEPNAINCNNPTNNQMNADILLSSTSYPNSQISTDDVNSVIVFLANLATNFPNPGFKDTDTKATRDKFMERGDVQKYVLATRTLAALQSMALSNFNLLAQSRLIKEGLGKQIGMKTFPDETKINDASQLQVEKYLIERRLNNPKWYTAMNTATPIGLQRETLFVLAEMQRQIFELRMVNERMLATLSTMQMTMLQMSKPQLAAQAENITNPPQTSTPTPTVPPPPPETSP